jgi:uncharacterized repeat protein (TIGR03843 family)
MPAHERPPASSDLSGWSPDSGLGLDQATEFLATGELTVVGRLPWSSNLTFLVSVDTGSDQPLGAVYKPGRGERSLWDFPDRLYRREVAAYALSEALGWGLVPPTVVREDGPLGEGSLQLFVDADFSQHYFTLFEEGGHEEALRTVCAFDVVANNADRKSGHVLRGPDGKLWGIDHGLCFHRHTKLRTVIWDFAEEPVDDDLLEDLATVAGSLPDQVGRLLSGPEIAALQARIDDLVETATFPVPEGDHPPYPWPLV